MYWLKNGEGCLTKALIEHGSLSTIVCGRSERYGFEATNPEASYY